MATKFLGFKQSPNYSKGRSGQRADIIVYHVTEGGFDGAWSWLSNKASGASSHFVTAQDGRYIQLVDLPDMAWCNGNTSATIGEALNNTVRSRPNINANLYTFSIENEGYSYKGNYGVPTAPQREAIGEVTKKIVDYILTYNPNWRATRENNIGHCDIRSKAKPSCPAPNYGEKFPFDEIINEINKYIDEKLGTNTPEVLTGAESNPSKPPEITPVDHSGDYVLWPGITNHGGMDSHQIPFVLSLVPSIQATMDCGVLASVRIAQAILVSGWGQSKLSRDAHNPFGTKADRNWHGAIYNTGTGKWSPTIGTTISNFDFKAYDSNIDAVLDHAEVLSTNPKCTNVIGNKDYKTVINGLKTAGYLSADEATKMISIIETNKLTWFDSLKQLDKEEVVPSAPDTVVPTDVVAAAGIKVDTIVKINKGATTYTGGGISSFVYDREYSVSSYKADRVVLDATGINTPVNVHDLIIIRNGIPKPTKIGIGSFVKIKSGATWMNSKGTTVPTWALASTYRVDILEGERAVLNTDGINSPVNIKYLELV